MIVGECNGRHGSEDRSDIKKKSKNQGKVQEGGRRGQKKREGSSLTKRKSENESSRASMLQAAR